MAVTQSILAALVKRASTGVGCRVDIAMLDVAAYWNFPDMLQDCTFLGDERQLRESLSPVAATSDGHIMVVPVSGQQMDRTGQAFGHPEWKHILKAIDDPALLGRTMIELVESATKSMTTAEALAVLAAADVPASEVLTRQEHLRDAQVEHNNVYRVEPSPIGPIRTVRYPALIDGRMLQAPFTLPTVGQHTDEVMRNWVSSA